MIDAQKSRLHEAISAPRDHLWFTGVLRVVEEIEREAHAAGFTEAREKAVTEIDVFQDIVGWQPEECRNRLVVKIREKVRDALTSKDPK